MAEDETQNEDVTDEEDVDDDLEDSLDSDDEDNEDVDEVATLRAELDALKATTVSRSDINQLKSAVGRIQSLAAKVEAGDGNLEKFQKQIAEQFQNVDTTLGSLLDGLDEAALSPEARTRALTARQAAQAAAAKAQLMEELRQELAPKEPEKDAEPSPAAGLEAEMVSVIKAAGLDDSDERFDWSEANRLLASQGSQGVRAYFLNKIVEIKAEDSSDSRREERKKRAGGGSPKRAGGTRSAQEVIEASYNGEEISVADRIKALQELGVDIG